MTVYLVTRGEYDHYAVCGAFSSRENADQYVRTLGRYGNQTYGEPRVEPLDVDTCLAEQWLQIYCCSMDADGNTTETLQEGPELVEPGWWERWQPGGVLYTVFSVCSSVSAVHAREKCAEFREDFLKNEVSACWYGSYNYRGNGKLEITKALYIVGHEPAAYANSYDGHSYHVLTFGGPQEAERMINEMRQAKERS